MKTYLKVPWEERYRAKALGARWDPAQKLWYVPDAVDLVPFLEWVPSLPPLSKTLQRVLRSGRHLDSKKKRPILDRAEGIRLWVVREREKRCAALHEASHAAVIRHFGGCARPEIWRNEREKNSPLDNCETAWLGRCYMLAAPGDMRFARGLKKQMGIIRCPKRWPVYVGLAGFVGELVAQGEREAWALQDSYMNALDAVQISATDLAMVQRSTVPTERVFAKTIDYLTAVWPQIIDEANWLIATADEDASSPAGIARVRQ
jgi:hypothetical protein